MDALQKIVKVTQQQYDTLKNGGTVGGYTGLNSNYIYLVQEDYNDITYANLNSTTSLGTIGTTSKLYAVGVDANGKLAVNVPWIDTNTDTKVTAVGNHYTPANGTNLTASSSGTAARGSTKVLTNVAIDAAGHVTGGTWYTLPSSDNTDTHYTNYLQIKGNGAEAVKFEQNANKTLNLKPSGSVSISAASGEITISATDTTYSAATQSAAGLMSIDDKKKLDGIAANATKVTTDTVSGWGYTKNTGTVTQIKLGTAAYNPSSGVVSLPAYPTALKNPNSMTIKVGTDIVSSYDGSTAKTFTVSASTTAGAFTISDGTTTRTIQLAGKFTDADTKNTAGTSSDSTLQLYLVGANSKSSAGVVTHTSDNVYMMSNNLYANAFYAASDRRLKENIKDLDLNCLDLVNNINLREFSWKTDEEHKPVIGAIAQELKKALPEKYAHEFIGGKETDDEYLSINDSKLVYLLIGAIQEQQKEIESLKAKIDSKIV